MDLIIGQMQRGDPKSGRWNKIFYTPFPQEDNNWGKNTECYRFYICSFITKKTNSVKNIQMQAFTNKQTNKRIDNFSWTIVTICVSDNS